MRLTSCGMGHSHGWEPEDYQTSRFYGCCRICKHEIENLDDMQESDIFNEYIFQCQRVEENPRKIKIPLLCSHACVDAWDEEYGWEYQEEIEFMKTRPGMRKNAA